MKQRITHNSMPYVQQPYLLLLVLLLSLSTKGTHGFHFPTSCKQPTSSPLSMTTYSSPNETTNQLYNINGSGWKSPKWNWGSSQGTGHDCALICRKRWDDRSDRRKMVESLLSPVEFKASHPNSEVSFEEIKLILGLAWQNGRWDGSDGGKNGYSAVLSTLASARRYEDEDEVISALSFIEDVSARFKTISRNAEELKRMKAIANDVRGKHAGKEEVFMDRRTCAGMVLDAMNFVDNGL
mmetsp:Transcript_41351/g.74548  ORF Transcript_41351/g.74548 Transcript_41351/m.74548 type:complete len:239 (+) Transcript_41351:41-757(+)